MAAVQPTSKNLFVAIDILESETARFDGRLWAWKRKPFGNSPFIGNG